MGFPETFVDYIMACVTTVTYAVSINGSTMGTSFQRATFGKETRVYLYHMCRDIINKPWKIGKGRKTEGLRISKHGPPILYLMYADDLLITCKAKHETCATLKNILQIYSRSAGQEINKSKSSIIHHPKL